MVGVIFYGFTRKHTLGNEGARNAEKAIVSDLTRAKFTRKHTLEKEGARKAEKAVVSV